MTPHYERTYVALRQFADAIIGDGPRPADGRNGPSARVGALAGASRPLAALPAVQGVPDANPDPRSAGRGSASGRLGGGGGIRTLGRLIAAVPLDDVIAHLHAEHIALETGPVSRRGALGPLRSVYFRDPDGSLVEVAEYVEARPPVRAGQPG